MIKYVIAVLVFIALLAAMLLYVGDDARLIITSTADTGLLKFPPMDLSWQSVIVLMTLTLIGVLALWTFIGWLWRLPSRLKSGAGMRRRNKALDAMEEALIAGAEGDAPRARRKAEKARGLIKSAALGQIISAQAAEASGDSAEAISHYRAMLTDEKTLATGQRGLAQQLLATGDLSGAIEHAGRAYEESKSARWALDVLFQAQIADHRWADAAETLKLAESRKHIEKDVSERRRAVLMTAEASRLKDEGNMSGALDAATKAAQNMPEFAPGVALAASLLVKSGETKEAGKLIEKAWAAAPHPALALAFRDTLTWEEGKIRDKRISQLIKKNADHRESQILKAEEALLAGDGVTAWSALSPLMQIGEPSGRLCMLASQAETMLNNPKDAAVWTSRASTAPSEPDWTDLDPEGEAFDYTNQDWRRLVFSYGEKGELIHPRFESGAARRAIDLAAEAEPEAEIEAKAEPEISADTPEPEPKPEEIEAAEPAAKAADDLALRLDSLLGDDAKPKA